MEVLTPSTCAHFYARDLLASRKMNQILPIVVEERLFPLVIIKWKVSINQNVKKQQELAIIEVVEEEKSLRKVIKSKYEGRIVKLAKEGIILETGYVFVGSLILHYVLSKDNVQMLYILII